WEHRPPGRRRAAPPGHRDPHRRARARRCARALDRSPGDGAPEPNLPPGRRLVPALEPRREQPRRGAGAPPARAPGSATGIAVGPRCGVEVAVGAPGAAPSLAAPPPRSWVERLVRLVLGADDATAAQDDAPPKCPRCHRALEVFDRSR